MERADVRADLVDAYAVAMDFGGANNGYAVAKQLDSLGWTGIDAALVDILNGGT